MTRAIQAASFFTALTASLALMLFPFLLRGLPAERLHSALPILLLGISSAFVYGIGFKPNNRILSVLFGPIVAWIMIAGGIFMISMG
jgi:predicted membrane protein